MRCRCIADLIDRFHRCVNSRIKSDRVLRAGDIKIDGARKSDDVDAVCRELLSAAVGAVAADNDKALDTVLIAGISRVLLAFLCSHFRTARRIEDRAAALDCIRYILGMHLDKVLLHETVIASVDAVDLETLRKTSSDNGTDRRVHSRRIAS